MAEEKFSHFQTCSRNLEFKLMTSSLVRVYLKSYVHWVNIVETVQNVIAQ